MKRIDLDERGPDAIGQGESVARGAVMIARGKPLNVQPPDAAGRQNHGLGSHHQKPFIVQILKHGTGTRALLVTQQLHGRGELQELDLLVEHLILEHPHDFEAGVIRAGQQPRPGTASALFDVEVAVRVPVEEHAQFQQPFRNGRPLFHHRPEQLMVVLHVTALEGIQEMLDRGIVGRHGNLHATLRHHRIRISQAQLRGQEHVRPLPMGVERRGASRAATPHHQDVHLVVRRQGEVFGNHAVAFQDGGEFPYRQIPFIGPERHGTVCGFPMIGMKFFYQGVALGRREFGQGLLSPGVTGVMDYVVQGLNIHVSAALPYDVIVAEVCCNSSSLIFRMRSQSSLYCPSAMA